MPGSNHLFIIAGISSCLVAVLHIIVIIGGADWYRLIGAGEALALMAEQGDLYPALLTATISLIFMLFGLYAFSGAGVIPKLPALRPALMLITLAYCARGFFGLLIPVFVVHPYVNNLGVEFWVTSSVICLAIGVVHAMGLR